MQKTLHEYKTNEKGTHTCHAQNDIPNIIKSYALFIQRQ